MKFTDTFLVDDTSESGGSNNRDNIILKNEPREIVEFIQSFNGKSFNNGIYRIHSLGQISQYSELAGGMFPDFSKRIICFASDWLGRQFAMDAERIDKGKKLILMLDPGAGEVLEIPATFMDFHENELINYTDEVLASNFYSQWLQQGGLLPEKYECIGYKVPLFLGGLDELGNIERIDMKLYWSLCSQLLRKTLTMQEGQSILEIQLA